MLIRASAGESQPARSVYCRSNGERANRICNLHFDAEVGAGDAICVRIQRRNRFTNWLPGSYEVISRVLVQSGRNGPGRPFDRLAEASSHRH